MKKLKVDLGTRGYEIVIGSGLCASVGGYVPADARKALLVSDSNVWPLYGNAVAASLQGAGLTVTPFVMPAGEKSKTLATLGALYGAAADARLTRSDCIVALGGGVVGDTAGFAAATYLRGVPYLQVPTTLLAQVDSSVGGKVAVDLPQGKNLAGCFYQPVCVLADIDCLMTLPGAFFRDGMGEVIKYGCIRSESLFRTLEELTGREAFSDAAEDLIACCCEIKRQIVERDERDRGERMLLNFGHTYGHALEKYYRYEFSHGRAVAVGMARVTRISEARGQTEKGTAERLESVLRAFSLPTDDPAPVKDVVPYIGNDKKNLGARLNAVLLKKIGEAYLYPTDPAYFGGADE